MSLSDHFLSMCLRVFHIVRDRGCGMSPVEPAMGTCPAEDVGMSRGCMVICNMALGDSEGQVVADFGGIEVVLKAMYEYPRDVDVQQAGCGALANLAHNIDNRRMHATSSLSSRLLARVTPIHRKHMKS